MTVYFCSNGTNRICLGINTTNPFTGRNIQFLTTSLPTSRPLVVTYVVYEKSSYICPFRFNLPEHSNIGKQELLYNQNVLVPINLTLSVPGQILLNVVLFRLIWYPV